MDTSDSSSAKSPSALGNKRDSLLQDETSQASQATSSLGSVGAQRDQQQYSPTTYDDRRIDSDLPIQSTETANRSPDNGQPTDATSPFEEEYDNDYDSAYGESISRSETTSLAEDIVKYREENGRTYHNYGSTEHWGPNDEEAKDQQDLSHHYWTLVLNDNFFIAPIQDPQNILDLGTGTGIWAIDVGDRFPSATVTGTDLSPIQPIWTPPNTSFLIDDFNISDWDLNEKYDLIHERELLGSVKDWPEFFSNCFKSLKPGGWVDCAEPDIQIYDSITADDPNSPNNMWVSLFNQVGDRSGMPWRIAMKLKGWLEEAGFINVEERKITVPVGHWPDDKEQRNLGLWNMVRLDKGTRDFTERRMRNIMGWNDNEIDVLIARTRSYVKNTSLKSRQDMYFVCGQKPERRH